MNIKVTAIGEILFDVYPEYKKLGGAPFNFLYHVWKLTGRGNFISRIGKDEEGIEILKYLKERNFDTEFIQTDSKHTTGAVDIKLDENKVPSFNILKDRAYDYIELTNKSITAVQNSKIIYLGTLAQRNAVSRKTIQSLSKKALKVFCDLNIRQNFYSREIVENTLNICNILKLNSDELKLITGLLDINTSDEKEAARQVLSKYNLELLCITVGSKGAYLFNNNEESHYKSKVDKIVDTVGAGDAYAAMMCIGYLLEWKIKNINKVASEFAAEICKVKGAIPGDEQLYKKYREMINNE